jgi:hypothetical protein
VSTAPSFRTKPLGQKAYGHIPHLPGSRIGPGDHHVHAGQARIATEKIRDRHDRILVQEKLDGSNCAVAKIGGVILPLVRSGYVATSSPYEQHRHFANWVYARQEVFFSLLEEGERVCGEWLMQAHGTRYALPHEPFVAFDLMRGTVRLPYDACWTRLTRHHLVMPRLLWVGGPCSVEKAIDAIQTSGHGALDPVEGAVWRVERREVVDYLCKFVRPDKRDGTYLPDITGQGPVWNWYPTP